VPLNAETVKDQADARDGGRGVYGSIAGKLDLVVGRDEEVSRMMRILVRFVLVSHLASDGLLLASSALRHYEAPWFEEPP